MDIFEKLAEFSNETFSAWVRVTNSSRKGIRLAEFVSLKNRT